MDRIARLVDAVHLLHELAQEGPARGSGRRALAEQIHALALAKQVASLARTIVGDHRDAITHGRESGPVQGPGDVVVQVAGSPKFKAWKQTELRSAVRPVLLWDDEDYERSGEEVLDLLWDPTTGLHPLSGDAMRIGVFRERFKMDPEQFATKTPGKSVTFLAGESSLQVELE